MKEVLIIIELNCATEYDPNESWSIHEFIDGVYMSSITNIKSKEKAEKWKKDRMNEYILKEGYQLKLKNEPWKKSQKAFN